jgi:hypothetical protein
MYRLKPQDELEISIVQFVTGIMSEIKEGEGFRQISEFEAKRIRAVKDNLGFFGSLNRHAVYSEEEAQAVLNDFGRLFQYEPGYFRVSAAFDRA